MAQKAENKKRKIPLLPDGHRKWAACMRMIAESTTFGDYLRGHSNIRDLTPFRLSEILIAHFGQVFNKPDWEKDARLVHPLFMNAIIDGLEFKNSENFPKFESALDDLKAAHLSGKKASVDSTSLTVRKIIEDHYNDPATIKRNHSISEIITSAIRSKISKDTIVAWNRNQRVPDDDMLDVISHEFNLSEDERSKLFKNANHTRELIRPANFEEFLPKNPNYIDYISATKKFMNDDRKLLGNVISNKLDSLGYKSFSTTDTRTSYSRIRSWETGAQVPHVNELFVLTLILDISFEIADNFITATLSHKQSNSGVKDAQVMASAMSDLLTKFHGSLDNFPNFTEKHKSLSELYKIGKNVSNLDSRRNSAESNLGI